MIFMTRDVRATERKFWPIPFFCCGVLIELNCHSNLIFGLCDTSIATSKVAADGDFVNLQAVMEEADDTRCLTLR